MEHFLIIALIIILFIFFAYVFGLGSKLGYALDFIKGLKKKPELQEKTTENLPDNIKKILLATIFGFFDFGKNIIGLVLIIGGLLQMFIKDYLNGLIFLLIGFLFLFIRFSKLVDFIVKNKEK